MTIQIGPFELREPLPDLRQPRMLVALQPWVDVGSVGTMALAFAEEALDAQPLGQLSRPGAFYDFTRYRPVLRRRGGQREVTVPNTFLHSARTPDGPDWLFLHCLEPHALGEDYVEGLVQVVKRLGVRQYAMIGSMYAAVPHTRPPIASGGSTNPETMEHLRRAGVRESNYEGPTTILAMLGSLLPPAGIETSTIVLQLPAYAQIERDYRGLHAVLELLNKLYGLPLDLEPVREEMERQVQAMDETVAEDERLAAWLHELERLYDAEAGSLANPEPGTDLSPELERFLRDVQQRGFDSETR